VLDPAGVSPITVAPARGMAPLLASLIEQRRLLAMLRFLAPITGGAALGHAF